MREVLVKIARNTVTNQISESDSIRLIGSYGVMSGAVVIRIDPSLPNYTNDIFLHIRFNRNVPSYQLDHIHSFDVLSRNLSQAVLGVTNLH